MVGNRMSLDSKEGPLKVGGRFLKYSIQRLLGTGGHAWVYQGNDPFLDVQVAIKILHRPGGVTNDMLRRGQVEAKLLYRLKHEYIVNVLDAGITDDGLLYIVMELVHGDTLRRLLLKKNRLALADTLSLFAKIADGVEAAHAFGAIHRDLKPENIIVHGDFEPKVLDFGIAKVVDAAGFTTEKDVIHGTVLYMAPEQLQGERATARSDVYALGLILFETLYGRHPLLLKNQRPTVHELTWMQLSVKPPRLDEIDGSIPRDVARLVERMILKVPAHRVATMSECGQVIRECMARMASEALPPLVNVVTERIVDTDRDAPRFEVSNALSADRSAGVASTRTGPSVAGRISSPPPSPRPGAVRRPTPRLDELQAAAAPISVAPVTTATPSTPSDAAERPGLPLGFLLRVLAASCVAGAAVGGVYLGLTGQASKAVATSASAEAPRKNVAKDTTVSITATAPAPLPAASAAVPQPRASAVAVVVPSAMEARAANASIRPAASATIAPQRKAKAEVPPEERAENQLWVETRREKRERAAAASAAKAPEVTPPWPTRQLRTNLE
jgi:serine/threonine protein kinase